MRLTEAKVNLGIQKFENAFYICLAFLQRWILFAHIIQMFKTLVTTLLQQIVQVVVVQGSKKILTNSLKITHVDALKKHEIPATHKGTRVGGGEGSAHSKTGGSFVAKKVWGTVTLFRASLRSKN